MDVKCSNCGAILDSDTTFCSVCGSIIEAQKNTIPPDADNNAAPAQHPPAAYTEPAKKEQKKKKGKKKFLIPIILAVLALFIFFIILISKSGSDDNSNSGFDKTNPIGKTVMIYVVGSDLESEGKCATVDLSEISRSGVDTETNNILVCTGGAAKWHNDYISAEENAILKLNQDSFEKLESYPASNMGESSTLTRFISYAMGSYPNDQYVLILWNHGSGPIFGYGADELFLSESGISDMLTMTELQTAFDNANISEENKFELIGFDACIMSNLETAWCLKDYANYFVASQETEPGIGWDYSFLKDLENYQNGKALATEIIDSYYKTSLEKYNSDVELTLSCLDLSKIEETEKCLNDLFADVNTYMNEDGFSELSKKRYETKAFAKSSNPDDLSVDIVDLYHMATLLEEKYPEKAKALKDSVSGLVCYSKTNVENASGVSIWYPFESAEYIEYFINIYDDYDFADNYTKYVHNFSLIILGVSPDEVENFNNNTVTTGSDNIAGLSLTPEQQATIAGAEYVIYYKIPAKDSVSGKDEYMPVYCGQDFYTDDNGNLFVNYKSNAIFAVDESTGDDNGLPVALYYIYDGSSELKLYAKAYFSDSSTGATAQNVIWMVNTDGSSVNFGNAKPVKEDDTGVVAQKELINPDDYNTYAIGNPSYYMSTDENGNNILTKSGNSYSIMLSKQSGYHLEHREIEDLENYYIVFNVTDIYGQTYHTSVTPLVQ